MSKDNKKTKIPPLLQTIVPRGEKITFIELPHTREGRRDVRTSPTDANTPPPDVSPPSIGVSNSHIDQNLLGVIVHELSQIEVDPSNLPVRMSKREKQDNEEFIYTKLRSRGLTGKDISMSRLLRYSLRYMIRVHPDEFAEVLHNVFRKSNKLSI